MMMRGVIKKGAYFDSITLMRVGKAVSSLPGVEDAAVVMGTHTNKDILKASNLLLPEFEAAGDTDLLIAVKAGDEKGVQAALAGVEDQQERK